MMNRIVLKPHSQIIHNMLVSINTMVPLLLNLCYIEWRHLYQIRFRKATFTGLVCWWYLQYSFSVNLNMFEVKITESYFWVYEENQVKWVAPIPDTYISFMKSHINISVCIIIWIVGGIDGNYRGITLFFHVNGNLPLCRDDWIILVTPDFSYNIYYHEKILCRWTN